MKPWNMDELIVENARLKALLTARISLITRLTEQVNELHQQLGQAQAGMEMADLIKRMIS